MNACAQGTCQPRGRMLWPSEQDCHCISKGLLSGWKCCFSNRLEGRLLLRSWGFELWKNSFQAVSCINSSVKWAGPLSLQIGSSIKGFKSLWSLQWLRVSWNRDVVSALKLGILLMQSMGIPFQCVSHSGDVLCIPRLGLQVNLKRSSCLSVMWGGPHVLSLLGCFSLETLFTAYCFSCHGRDLSLPVCRRNWSCGSGWMPCIL